MRAVARILAGAAVLLVATLAVQAQTQTTRPTVALLDFDYGTVQKWWSGNDDVGAGIADLIVDELVNDGSFRVIERKRLQALLAEQNFSNSERADPSAKTMAQIGKVLGVRYLIVGSVTKFGTEQSSRGIGGGVLSNRLGAVGQVGTAQGKATVAIAARIIDTTTGEIMVSARGEGTSKRSGLLLGGGGGGSTAGGGVLRIGASDFRDTIIGEATEAAVKATVEKILAAKGRLQ